VQAKFIDRFLWTNWDTPPASLDFRSSCQELLNDVRAGLRADPVEPRHWLDLFVKVPLVVTAALDHQLEAGDGGGAERVYRWAIGLARATFTGRPNAARCALGVQPPTPAALLGRPVESKADQYSWRASCPALVRSLAPKVLVERRPDLVLAGSHGSIRSATLLSLYLSSRLYFLRLSRFKRRDPRPMISPPDQRYLAREALRGRHVLVFEEDCMSGRSLDLLRREAAAIFDTVATASVLRSAQCNPRPDSCVAIVA
jgi:hypoxanthine phosphoribosyltransferase